MSDNKDIKDNLEKPGWKLALVSGGDHLKRTLEMYRELGIEIYIEKVDPLTWSGCIQCYIEGNEELYKVYTKLKED